MRARTIRLLVLPLLAGVLAAPPHAAGGAQRTETVNCIVAVVGPRVISLTDVKLAEAFGVFDVGEEADASKRRRLILEKLIDQKVVVDLARENIPVGADKVEKAWTALLDKIGRDEAKRRLEAFGAGPVDLLPFLEEKLLAEAVIETRFSRGAPVSLKEIETYYAETYAPARKAAGLSVPPLIEVVDAVESEIQRGKMAERAAQWVKNLRGQAEIEIRPDCLKAP
jgi:hypothetical protein